MKVLIQRKHSSQSSSVWDKNSMAHKEEDLYDLDKEKSTETQNSNNF